MRATSVVYCYRALYKLYFFPAPRCSTRHAKIKHTLVIHIQFSHIVRTRTRRTLSLGWSEPYGSKFSFKVPAVAPTTSRSNADSFYAREVAASKYTDSRTSSSYTDDITRSHYTRVAAASTYANAGATFCAGCSSYTYPGLAASTYTYTAVASSD